jgi:para-aminobenzoate synthetase component 1
MTECFPYPILNRQQIILQINRLAASRIPFLFIVDYKAEYGYVIKIEDLDKNYIQFEINNQKNQLQIPKNEAIQWDVFPLRFSEYETKFNSVQKHIHKGNSFLTNLTQPTEVETNLSLLDLFECGSAKYKLWLKDKFIVLSPETFVQINGQTITSFPMKGTIDASIPYADEIILNDPKEKAEHATIVDLIRNDLSLVASNVEVKCYRYIEKLTTNKHDLLQVSSKISGLLPDNYYQKLGDILFTLLPAGSISGAPKPKTLEIIEQVEAYHRGFYTGICGLFDGENLDSTVMIRFIEQQNDKMIFKSGGGITAQSDIKKEYEELIQKVYVPIR